MSKVFNAGDRVEYSECGREVHVDEQKNWTGRIQNVNGEWVYVQWDKKPTTLCIHCNGRGEVPKFYTEHAEHLRRVR
jgi:hypothetical protein